MKITEEGEMKIQKKKKIDRKQEGTEAIVKGWELNDFVLHLS